MNKDLEILYENAEFHFKNGDHLEALTLVRDILKLDPNHADTWFLKGNIHYALLELEEAKNASTKAAELNPNNEAAWYNKGAAHFALQEHEEAAYSFKKVTELYPDDLEAWHLQGVMWAVLKKYKESIDCYNKIIELDPNYESEFTTIAIDTIKNLEKKI